MRQLSKERVRFVLCGRAATAAGLMGAGALLLSLGLPTDWIDLAAFTLAVVTARPAPTARPDSRPAPRSPRRGNPLARTRARRGDR